jgi:hypothetical protein
MPPRCLQEFSPRPSRVHGSTRSRLHRAFKCPVTIALSNVIPTTGLLALGGLPVPSRGECSKPSGRPLASPILTALAAAKLVGFLIVAVAALPVLAVEQRKTCVTA